jgi:hypothetical protein
MNAHDELFQLADAAAAALNQCRADEIREPLGALKEMCDEVGRAWSGSNIGYHFTTYYAGLQPKPPHVQFSAEWGLMDRWPTHQPDPGWETMDPKQVSNFITSQVGDQKLKVAVAAIAPIRADFESVKENAISVLSAILSTTTDSFLKRQLDTIEKLEATHPQQIEHEFISGQVWSRDSLAMSQGLSVAPHQALSTLPLSTKGLAACRIDGAYDHDTVGVARGTTGYSDDDLYAV